MFPDNIASHTREQISYFGEDGLLRRHEYVVDIMGGARGPNYAHDSLQVDGIMVPRSSRETITGPLGRFKREKLIQIHGATALVIPPAGLEHLTE